MRRTPLLIPAILLTALGANARGEVELWAGSGANEATLVIDWSEAPGAGPSLAWGYRWDGVATGLDMLRAIVAADERLFARISPDGAFGVAVYGLGYDADGDRAFALNDATGFSAEGLAVTGPSDLAESVDPDDLYEEGWQFAGFWHYGVAASDPRGGGAWGSASLGPSSRSLTDGAWDAWTFAPSYSYESFPDDPAPAPSTDPPGDYNRDGRVDAADYVVWRDTLDASPVVAGGGADGDLSGLVDQADLAVWASSYGRGDASAAAVPEPAAAPLVFLSMLFLPWGGTPRHQLGACD